MQENGNGNVPQDLRVGACLSDRSRGFCRVVGEVAANEGGTKGGGECCEGYDCVEHSMANQVLAMLYFGLDTVADVGGCVFNP